MLRPLNSYASSIWATAAETYRKEQKKTAPRISNIARFIRNKDIQKDIQQTSVKDNHKNLSKTFFEKLGIDDNSAFREIVEYNLNNDKTIRKIINK
ncbi:hypothetical protein AVEN_238598-1 [Araneus ventricosus]|uniref:Uncharacterized protein n=1 Tax=Araneus ventricosus TaxID=182803 RepID=A0A4Y2GPY0_ARAVE|nr:hypothetical protein AVEN_238598-1 [Araneus ventricosus]